MSQITPLRHSLLQVIRPALFSAARLAPSSVRSNSTPSPSTHPSPAFLKVNEYASSYVIPESHLPPEESLIQPLEWGNTRITFHKPNIVISRGKRSDPISLPRLRDNCRCSRCIDPSTRQKLHTSGSMATTRLSKAFKGFDANGASGVHITWSDGHSSFYSERDLRGMVDFSTSKTNINHHYKRTFWDRDALEASNLRMRYEDVQANPDGLLEMLRQAQVFGLVIISGVPTERTSDRDCELRAFMSKIGEIRNTFYGETWDVKSVENSKNVAYTSQDLGLHMDLLYFSSPPRFQALHCLRNRAKGGSSYFVDSFHAAQHIQQTDEHTTTTLAKYPLNFEYDNDGHYLSCRHFVMNQLDSLRSHVNWSPPFQGMMRRVAPPRMAPKHAVQAERDMYDALAKFEAALARPEGQYEFTMQEGDLIFFDNRRVLHARRAYGEGERWLKGCYLDGEVVWDRLATL